MSDHMGSEDIVVCSLEPWDMVWRRNQYLLDGLLRRNQQLRVLLVEPAADPLFALRSGQRPTAGAGLRELLGYEGRLYAFQPTKWLPRIVGPIADSLLFSSARRAARRLGMRRPVLWVNDPKWAGLLETGWPAIYDITDDWVEADRSSREHDRIVVNEDRLMRDCAVVVVCSKGLERTKSRIRRVELVQNAVDVDWYRKEQPRPDDLPQPPVVLYVGTLHEDRLDVLLCRRIAERLPEVGGRLVFVGPNALSETNSLSLLSSAAISLLGPRPHTTIPGYLQHADILLVPHLVDDFTESLDPIKLYEYEAVERPIASTPVAGFRELSGLPGVSVAPADYLSDRIMELLKTPPDRVGPFEPADWSMRVKVMEEIVARARKGPLDAGA